MTPERDPERSGQSSSSPMPPFDPAWWQALRRTAMRLLDLAEHAARTDDEFRRDVIRLVGAGEIGAGEIGAGEIGAGDDAEAVANVRRETSPSASTAETSPHAPVTLDAGSASHASLRERSDTEPGEAAPPLSIGAPLPALVIGPRLVRPAPTPYPERWMRDVFDPARVAASCRIKADACRWQLERRLKLDAGEDVSTGDYDRVARAREQNVWLWMVSPTKWRERSDAAFAIVAGCYDALADAAELMGLADQFHVQQEPALRLLAEAQSGLRAAVEDYASTRRDDDQGMTFTWLREQTDARRVFVDHLQLDNPAPPQNHDNLRHRIAEARGQVQAVQRRGHETGQLFKKLMYHAKKLGHVDSQSLGLDDVDLRKTFEVAADIQSAGIPPSDTRVRDALLPAYDVLSGLDPDTLAHAAPSFMRILESMGEVIDRQHADDELTGDTGSDAHVAEPDALILRARTLVAGRSAVLIGGQPSELHRARLETGLALRSLEWIRLAHHEAFDAAATALRREGVGLALLMTRWRSHRDGPAARDICRKLAIPLVELPAGYNLRQVSHRITEQFGGAHAVP